MKNSFILYGSWGPMVKAMSDEGAGQLLKACFAFSAGEAFTIENETAAAIFETVKATMQADKEKYNEVSKKRREAALASKSKQMQAKAPKSTDLLYESDSDNESVLKEREKRIKKKEKEKPKPPPTVEQVREYAAKAGLNLDAERFVDYYTANGWKVGGRTPMKDWQAAARNWARRDKPAKPSKGFDYENQRNYTADDYAALERRLLAR